MVKPYNNNFDLPYFRPFVRKGNQTEIDIFLIGINPATPICKKHMDMDKYINLLLDYDRFYEEYEKIRLDNGKSKISRTRTGIVNFIEDVSSQTGKSILETNIIPYPTKNLKCLNKVPEEIKDYAKKIFFSILLEYSPKILIVFSKTSLESLIELLYKKEIINYKIEIRKTIKELEYSKTPVIEIIYPNGKKGAIFCCRHLMYHGINGNSFLKFKKNLIEYINKL